MLAAPGPNDLAAPVRATGGAALHGQPPGRTEAASTPRRLVAVGREAAVLVFASVLTLLLCVPGAMLRDPDTFWHIAAGQQIWAAGAVPRADGFSHTFAGAPWAAKEWLAQLAFYGAYSLAGWTGVAALAALVVAGTFALLFALLLRDVKPTIALVLTLAAFCATTQIINARPQLFGLPLLILWTFSLARAAGAGKQPSFWLVPLMALWANLHASFPVAFVFAAFLGLEAVLAVPPARRAPLLAGWAAFGLAALAATALTPYGYRAALIPLMVMEGNEAVPHIAEWQPTELNARSAVAAALFAVAALVMLSRRATLLRSVLVVLCAALAFKYARFLAPMTVAVAVLVAGPLGQRMTALKSRPVQGGIRLRARMRAVVTGLLATCAVVPSMGAPQPEPAIMPTAALQAARQAGLSGPVYNDYNFGGFLILNGVKTFVDGRTDQLFLNGFVTALIEAQRSATHKGLLALLDRHGVTWAIVEPGQPSAGLLGRMPGWSEIYRDEFAVVFGKGG